MLFAFSITLEACKDKFSLESASSMRSLAKTKKKKEREREREREREERVSIRVCLEQIAQLLGH